MTEQQYFLIVDYFDNKLSLEEEAALMKQIDADALLKKEFEFELGLRFNADEHAIEALNTSYEFESADAHIERINQKIKEPFNEEIKTTLKKATLKSWFKKHRLPLSIAASLIPVITILIFITTHNPKNIKTVVTDNSIVMHNLTGKHDSTASIISNKNNATQLKINDTALVTNAPLSKSNITLSYNRKITITNLKDKSIGNYYILTKTDNSLDSLSLKTSNNNTQQLSDTSKNDFSKQTAFNEINDELNTANTFNNSISNLYDSVGKLKHQCDELFNSEKITLEVKNINVLGINNTDEQIGAQFTQMLETALQNINCFKVKAENSNLSNAADNNNFSNYTTEKAQVIVMGLITQISLVQDLKKEISATAINENNKAQLGLIITLINAKTNEVIGSKLINATEAINNTSTSGYNNPTEVYTNNNSKLFENVSAKGIMQAAAFIVSKKDQMPVQEPLSLFTAAKKYSTEIFVSNSDNSRLKTLLRKLSKRGTIIKKDISDNEGYIKLEHTDRTDEIADFIFDNLSHKYNIIGCDSYAGCGEIKLERK